MVSAGCGFAHLCAGSAEEAHAPNPLSWTHALDGRRPRVRTGCRLGTKNVCPRFVIAPPETETLADRARQGEAGVPGPGMLN